MTSDCLRCNRPMRPTRTRPQDAPGTTRKGAHGNCETCTRHLKAEEDATNPPPEKPRPVVRFATITTRELEPLGWQREALCAETDPEAFFPEKGGSTRDAKKICLSCESRVDCLEYALENDERFGIWGGLSAHQRRYVQKARANA